MELSRQLRNYCPSYPEEHRAFEAMQLKGFEVADVLIREGNVTAFIGGHHLFVAPFKGNLEVAMTCDYRGEPLDDVSLLLLYNIDGQDAEMLDEIREGYEQWLAAPTFVRGDSWQHCADALHRIELWLEQDEASRTV